MVIRENKTPHIKIFQSHIHLVFETYKLNKIFWASYFSKYDMVKIKSKRKNITPNDIWNDCVTFLIQNLLIKKIQDIYSMIVVELWQ